MGGMLGNAAQAQEITAATLKGMSESSAVRMGCGAAFIGDMNDATVVEGVNTLGIVRETADVGRMLTTRTVGCLCLLAIIFVALKVIPKERKPVVWKMIKVMALVMFLGGARLAFQMPTMEIDDFTGAALWASTLIAIPTLISMAVSGIRGFIGLVFRGRMRGAESEEAGWKPALPEAALAEEAVPQMTVSVRGCEITLRNGETQITRVVELDHEGEEACATK
jgi:hypothetical protein